MSRKAKHALRSISNLLPDLSAEQFRKDGGTIIALIIVAVAMTAMSFYLAQEEDKHGRGYVGWLTGLAMMTLIFTALLFKAWFNTFHFSWYPFFCAITCMVLSWFVGEHYRNKGVDLNMNYFIIAYIAYVVLALQVAAIYQWAANDWRMSWKETPIVLSVVIGMNVLSIAVFVREPAQLPDVPPLTPGARCASSSQVAFFLLLHRLFADLAGVIADKDAAYVLPARLRLSAT